jgi:hypothetical protein
MPQKRVRVKGYTVKKGPAKGRRVKSHMTTVHTSYKAKKRRR